MTCSCSQDGRPYSARPGGVGPRAEQDAQIPLQHLRGHQEDRADNQGRDEARADSPCRGEVQLWQGGEESHQVSCDLLCHSAECKESEKAKTLRIARFLSQKPVNCIIFQIRDKYA